MNVRELPEALPDNTLPRDLQFPPNFQPEPLEGQIRAARADLWRFIKKHELATSMGHDLTPLKKALPPTTYNLEQRRRRSILYTLIQLHKQEANTRDEGQTERSEGGRT